MDRPNDTRPTDCESCGDTTDVVLVRRVYLPVDPEHPPGTDEPAADDVVATGELEWWCEVCRIHYPHQTD